MRKAVCLIFGAVTMAACSDDPARPHVQTFHGEFGSVLGAQEDGITIRVLNGTLDGQPIDETFELVVSGSFRDAWGNVYDPSEISVGTPISGHAESCVTIDVLLCGADDVIVELPVAGTG